MKRIRTVAVLPTLFTLGNLLCGFYAIAVAARVLPPDTIRELPAAERIAFHHLVIPSLDRLNPLHNLFLCAALILLAMVFDALDGYVARLANHTTDFGAQLDSLADMVTFGAAPGFLMVKMCQMETLSYRQAVWMIAGTYVACVALRLARFNVESDENDDHMYFSGLPSPAAAATIAGFALLFYTLRMDTNPLIYKDEIDRWVQRGLPVFTLMVSMLMVSRIPYPHLVSQLLKGQKSFAHVVGVVFALVTVFAIPGYALPTLAVGYVIVPPLIYFWQRFYARQTESEPLF